MPARLDRDGGGTEEAMRYAGIERLLPRAFSRYLLHVEAAIEDAVREFSAALPAGVRVLDAGAGETVHKPFFSRHRYVGVDLGIGDLGWNYRNLDAVADLARLPFRDACFDACLNVVTLEHVPEPARVLCEIGRVLKPGAPLLLIVPHEWEVHQAPHDFFRYTRHGAEYLLRNSGFIPDSIQPMGGYFRLLSRRLLNGLQFFPGLLFPLAALLLVPPALILPALDKLDREKTFTLGYICIARRRS
jgi:SAM-dependent methyltransferase